MYDGIERKEPRYGLRTAYLVGTAIVPILNSHDLRDDDRVNAGRVLVDLTENLVRADPERHVDDVGRILMEHYGGSE